MENSQSLISNLSQSYSIKTVWYQEKEKKVTDWQNIFAKDTSDKGLLPKIYNELLKLKNKKTNKPIKKWSNIKEDIIWQINI